MQINFVNDFKGLRASGRAPAKCLILQGKSL
jgi:hypothetical protein